MNTIKKPLILIVDDTPKNIQVLSNILHEKGYNICIVTSGSQALESVKTESPDLILLDIQMPEMDGFEVCQALKSNPETKGIPVIFLTAVIEPEKIVHGFELGASEIGKGSVFTFTLPLKEVSAEQKTLLVSYPKK